MTVRQSGPETADDGDDMKKLSRSARLRKRAHMWFLRRIPEQLMVYPFEVFLAALAVLSGIVFITLPGTSPDLWVEIVGKPVLRAFGGALELSGLTMIVGLRKRYRLALYPGLRLMSFLLTVYGLVDVLLVTGPTALPNTLLLLFIAYLALARSIYLRSVAEVMTVAREIRNGARP